MRIDQANLMRYPKLLVMTYYAPDARHGGGVTLRRLLEEHPDSALAWCHHDGPVTDSASRWSRVAQCSIPLLRRPNRYGLWRAKEYGNWTVHAPRVAARAAAFGREHDVEAVLGISPGISMWTGYLTAQELGVPCYLWVHDDPVDYAMYRRLGGLTRRRIGRCFRQAYRAADATFVISEPMRTDYLERHGRDATVLTPALPNATTNGNAKTSRERNGNIRIGFSGSLCGPDEWLVFLAALEQVYADRPERDQPRITVFSERQHVPIPEDVDRCGWVDVKGWRSEEEVSTELSECDFLYLPQWFAPHRRHYVSTSLPTKLISYLGLQVPVLFHVPSYSAAARIQREFPVGPLLDTTNTTDLARALGAALLSRRWWSAVRDIRDRVVQAFDARALRRRFHDVVAAAATAKS